MSTSHIGNNRNNLNKKSAKTLDKTFEKKIKIFNFSSPCTNFEVGITFSQKKSGTSQAQTLKLCLNISDWIKRKRKRIYTSQTKCNNKLSKFQNSYQPCWIKMWHRCYKNIASESFVEVSRLYKPPVCARYTVNHGFRAGGLSRRLAKLLKCMRIPLIITHTNY